MKVPACGTPNTRPFLSYKADAFTGLRVFSVQTTSRSFPIGLPLALVSSGRSTESASCRHHLSLGSASSCANRVATVGFPNSPGARQWVFEHAGKSNDGTQLVKIYSAVSERLVCTIGLLGGLEAGNINSQTTRRQKLTLPCPNCAHCILPLVVGQGGLRGALLGRQCHQLRQCNCFTLL